MARIFSTKRGHNYNNIINSEDHEFAPTAANIQNAIDDLTYPHGWTWIPPGTFDLEIPLDPPNYLTLLGAGTAQTILRPADNTVTEIININREQGTSNTQNRITIKNMDLDARDYANTVPLRIYNLAASFFENLRIRNYQTYGIYLDGFDATGYTFWNHFRNISSANTAAVVDRTLFHVEKRAIDCWIDVVWGDVKGGYGFRIKERGGWRVRDMWLTQPKSLIFINPTTAHVTDCIFEDCVSDTPTSHSFLFDMDAAYNVARLTFKRCHVIAQPANTDIFNFVGYAGGSFSRNLFEGCFDDGGALFRYIANWDTVGAFLTTNRFARNIMIAGAGGTYNNIPYSCIIDDYALNPRYQSAAAFANPTWVGTPTTGEVVVFEETTGGTTRIYVRDSAGWHSYNQDA